MGNEEYRFLVLDQLRELAVVPAALLVEPAGLNTTPAVAQAAPQAEAGAGDPVMVVTPAVQTVADAAAFTAAVQRAVRVAAGGAIAILGVQPDRPETGYGYVRADGDRVVGDKLILLAENQGTDIHVGENHRLRNPSKVPLEIIEVQSGSYLGEEDIVRLRKIMRPPGSGDARLRHPRGGSGSGPAAPDPRRALAERSARGLDA